MPVAYDPSRPLISIHVPKTGGSTVRETLRIWFGDDLLTHYVDESMSRPPRFHEPAGAMCIHGHFNRFRKFGVDDYYPDIDQFVTFLRDPFEQHVSLFHYLRRTAGGQAFQGRPVPIGAATRFEEFMEFLTAHRSTIQTTPANSFLAHLPGRLAAVPAAEMFASRFIHMGVTEGLNASLSLLAAKLNKPPVMVPPQNVSPRDIPLHPSHRRTHERLFPVEHAFYATIRELHADELRGAGAVPA